jgi:hypothetical protein
MSEPVKNTDRQLWREVKDDYYAPSIFVTEAGGIGIDVGGYVIVKPLREWHKLAAPNGAPSILDLERTRAEHPNLDTNKKLWLWKNFVDSRPEYWAFNNPGNYILDKPNAKG